MGHSVSGINGATGSKDRFFVQKVKLGKGSFGTVWRAVDRQDNSVVAIKQMNIETMKKMNVDKQAIENELSIMKMFAHENITRLFDIFEDQGCICLAIEYCDGGDLGDKINERGLEITEADAAGWMHQILSAISMLHGQDVIHRDIKPDNFMILGEVLKLADFGLALKLPRGSICRDKCGTPAYMAPEQHHLPNGRGYENSVDVWSAGVLFHQLMHGGKHPFLNADGNIDGNRLMHGVLSEEGTKLVEMQFQNLVGQVRHWAGVQSNSSNARFSEVARDLCKRMVEPDQSCRISSESAMRSPWFACARQSQELAVKQPEEVLKKAHKRRKGRASVSREEEAQLRQQMHKENDHLKSLLEDSAAKMQAELERSAILKGMLTAERQAQSMVLETRLLNASKPPSLAPELAFGSNAQSGPPLPSTLRVSHASDPRFELQARGPASGNSVAANPMPPRLVSAQLPGGWSDGSLPVLSQQGPPLAPIKETRSTFQCRPSQEATLLQAGTVCMYNSSSCGWIPAVVESFNDSDGTYNLNVKIHVPLCKLCVQGHMLGVKASGMNNLPQPQLEHAAVCHGSEHNGRSSYVPLPVSKRCSGYLKLSESPRLQLRSEAPCVDFKPGAVGHAVALKLD